MLSQLIIHCLLLQIQLWSYIDIQLVWDFSNIEKDNIKIIILSEIQDVVLEWKIVEWVTNKFIEPFKKAISNFNNWDKASEDKVEELIKVKDEFWKFLDNLWIKTIQADIESKITKINEDKENNINFTDTKKVVESLDIKGLEWLTPDEIFKKVNTKTGELSKKLDWLRWTWDELSKAIEKTWFGDTINWFLKGLTEGEWTFATIMKIILWLLFWKDFLSESWDSSKKSIQNLEKFLV